LTIRSLMFSCTIICRASCAGTVATIIVITAHRDLDGEQPASERFGVSVYVLISVFSAVANTLLGYTFAEGIVVHFWREATRGTDVSGCSILH
jgi:hypothetical protein